ncbi:MAG: leucine-rich repeat protein [Lachnospiraceae bacterium]|nr:leucine-rich repeat protein [Lachnospiraceae bacterium]
MDHQPVAFHGVTARYVKLTPKDSWGSANYWGLSEVIFTKQEETAITSVEETSVKTMKGQLPMLPSFVKVTYASGSEGTKAVEWDDFDKVLCDAEGEFTITGKLFGSDAEAYCTVVVKRSKEVDKKPLLKLLNEVTGKEESAYTKESWQALLAVYEMADQIYDSAETIQEEVDEICGRLQKAIFQLEMTVTPEQVEEQITLAGQMLAQTEIYTGEEGFEGQIAEADAAVFRDRFHALQAEYDKMAAEENLTEYEKAKLAEIQAQLTEAMDAFQTSIVHIDFTKLNELLAQVGGLDQAKYTEASWKELASARNEADAAVKNSSRVKQSEVDARTSRLALAMKNLVPKAEDSGKAPDQGSDKDTAILQGKVYESGNYRYKVTSTTKRTVEVVSLKKKNLTAVRIGSTVRLGGKDYKITSIASSAFKNNKKIKSAVMGKNVTSIRSKAFYGCRQLKSITIQTKKLTMKNVGSKAFKGISAKAVIKVPKAKVKSYARILKAKGAGKKMTVKKM